MLKVRLDRCPYEAVMFKNLDREVNGGLTVLVGCNGSGKTTFMNYIDSKYSKDEDYRIFRWNGLVDKEAVRQSMLERDISVLATLAMSSEGEEISVNMGLMAQQLGYHAHHDDRNIILLLDAFDSGLSIDNIVEVKGFFKDLLIPDVRKCGKEIYIIVAANSYELARGEDCIDVRTGKTIKFKDYEDYRAFIMNSREIKDEREHSV